THPTCGVNPAQPLGKLKRNFRLRTLSLKRAPRAADDHQVARRSAILMRARGLLASRALWCGAALLALASAGAIVAFGSRPLTTGVPAALALGLVLGRYGGGHGSDGMSEQLDETRRQLEAL